MKVLIFHTVDCGQCKAYKRIVDKVIPEFPTVQFEYVDAEEDHRADEYGVRSCPTTVIIDDKNNIATLIGIKPDLSDRIKSFFNL